MIRRLFAPLLFFALVSAQRIEFYDDWQPDAIGDASFAIRAAFEQRGYSARLWDRKAHRPLLLTWKSVQNWTDFKHWLGFGLSRKQVLEDDTAFLVLSNIGVHLRDLNLKKIPKNQLILVAWEPPTVQPELYNPKVQKLFSKIYTWHDDLVDNIQFFKFYHPGYKPRIPDLVPYEKRKFLTLIASRLSSKHPNQIYSEREKLIRFFEARPNVEFDLYGRNWEKRNFRSWKKTIPDKMDVLKQYRFSIAYENSTENGYITEKLWDCFAAGVVPIYWGAPNIETYVPSDCFIDRRQFDSDEALLSFLQAMSKEEWEGYVERAGAFLKTEVAKKFTGEFYIRTITSAVP